MEVELQEKSKRLAELDSLLNMDEKDNLMFDDGRGDEVEMEPVKNHALER